MKEEKKIENVTTFNDLVRLMKALKIGGQKVELYAETPVSGILKFPTDGSERTRIPDDFKPTNRYHVNYNFGTDYEGAMSRALGEDYTKGIDENVDTIIPNVLMRYKSTNNPCFIYINGMEVSEGKFNNGKPYTAEDEAMEKRYKSLAEKKSYPVKYRRVGVKNVTKLVANHVTYNLAITDWTYTPQEETEEHLEYAMSLV